ncbi:lipid biosynthesis B12-binding/radical SAM protein [Pseudodesulfovibrio sediminis]|uniref:B12-binding domain-containing radical SAM protein n=1 Tax=Pseudodesulfovibrio sediminis TaxID=2810563 RepID=A0ABN6ESI6_9BACT|nr:lipid biosynthesis B12-binding/radical SAM protein [Pseudodesulfovibrio sediminis]BCS88447.1 B12-binding domain-containing radical SAM protein [Pseudodesulfovibrio sediminis]
MARLLLISTNITVEPYLVYPLGMSVIAAALQNSGHVVRQFDFLAEGESMDALEQTLAEFKPDMTGISLRNIDNVDSFTSHENWYLEHVRTITAFLKIRGQTVIVGGPGFSLMPETIIEYLGADHGVVGEGERKMVQLVKMLEAGETPSRLLKPEQGLVSSEMCTPAWDTNILNFYIDHSGIANIQTKRGCENRCSYCSYPSIEGGKLRLREPDEVVDEVERLHLKHGAEFIFFTDSVFNDSQNHYLEVAELLARKNLALKWSAFFQPTPISRGELKLLKRAGLSAMEVGTDASTDETLSAMNKPFLFEGVRAFNEACVSEHIPCAHFVIFGGPGETPATVCQGIDNLNSLESCVVFPFSGIRLYKGTPLYAQAKKEGTVPTAQELLKPYYYFSPNIDQAWMNEELTKGFLGRRDRIFPPADAQDRMDVLHRFGYRGLLWDTLVTFADTHKPKQARAKVSQ